MIRVFISSAYSIGDQAANVRRQMDAADELIKLGFNPYVPLLWHFQHLVHPQDYHTWLEIDKDWIPVCDCVLRLAGESKGADDEVKEAGFYNMPVFPSIPELVEYYK